MCTRRCPRGAAQPGLSAEKAEHEREAAAAADAARQALACEDCGQQQAGGLCEACGYRRRTEALTVEAGLIAAPGRQCWMTWPTSPLSPPMSARRCPPTSNAELGVLE
ncbi:hypothetical protein ACWCOW_37185 [Streptomyces sp. NPDC001939]